MYIDLPEYCVSIVDLNTLYSNNVISLYNKLTNQYSAIDQITHKRLLYHSLITCIFDELNNIKTSNKVVFYFIETDDLVLNECIHSLHSVLPIVILFGTMSLRFIHKNKGSGEVVELFHKINHKSRSINFKKIKKFMQKNGLTSILNRVINDINVKYTLATR